MVTPKGNEVVNLNICNKKLHEVIKEHKKIVFKDCCKLLDTPATIRLRQEIKELQGRITGLYKDIEKLENNQYVQLSMQTGIETTPHKKEDVKLVYGQIKRKLRMVVRNDTVLCPSCSHPIVLSWSSQEPEKYHFEKCPQTWWKPRVFYFDEKKIEIRRPLTQTEFKESLPIDYLLNTIRERLHMFLYGECINIVDKAKIIFKEEVNDREIQPQKD